MMKTVLKDTGEVENFVKWRKDWETAEKVDLKGEADVVVEQLKL